MKVMMICGMGLLASALLPASIRASGLLSAIAGEAPSCDAPEVKIALLDQIYGRALTEARHTPGFAQRQRLGDGQASLFQQLDDLRNKPLLLIETSVERQGEQGLSHHRLSCMATISYRLAGQPASVAETTSPAQVRFTTRTNRKLAETTVTLQEGWQEPVALVKTTALDRYLHET
ncbi:hypothetical protein [Novosphingobium terrae]|uniref:hypothetical protein n=1 Tax=Novosphingobium terrae TaxID=2726189 RepID=UPI00197F5370|nr:hypothetical protein [Novosphingobium terrae]